MYMCVSNFLCKLVILDNFFFFLSGHEILTSNIWMYFDWRFELEEADTSTEYQTADLSDSNQNTSSWCFLAKCEASCEVLVRPRMICTEIRQSMTALMPMMKAKRSKVFIWIKKRPKNSPSCYRISHMSQS